MNFIRSLTFHICFYIVTAYIILFYGFLSVFNPKSVITGYKHWNKSTLWLLRNIVKIKITVRGAENIPLKGALVAMKHQSILETILLFAIFRKPAAIIKKELTYIPFISPFIRHVGHIPIDRKTGSKARREIIVNAKDRIKKDHQIVIFPEGTRSAVNTTPSYKKGVFSLYDELEMPCIPIALNTGMFWGRKSFFLNPGRVIVEILPPIETGLTADVFMTKLTTDIESATARLVQEAAAEQAAIRRGS